MNKATCQICGGILPPQTFFDSLSSPQIGTFCPAGHTAICSYECQENAIRFNACYRFLSHLRNISAIPFTRFQEYFEFPEKGGYALRKYNSMRRDPYIFALGLDTEKLKKLINSMG